MPGRLLFIDNLRIFCIIIVVMIHAAVTYSGIGSWYYNEPIAMGAGEKLIFVLFQSHAQAFSMSLFFFIAAYFIPASLERKGTSRFIRERLYRLGLPLIIYIFIIHPLCVKMAYPQVNLVTYWIHGITHLEFLGWTGPLWFAETLLIFSILYALIQKFITGKKMPDIPGYQQIIAVIIIIAIIAFSIRLIAPIGTSFANLQFCYFSAYIVMFYLGTRFAKTNVLETLPSGFGKRWLIVAFGVGIPLWILAGYIGKFQEGKLLILGGWNAASFFYAFWESFFCVTFIAGLFGFSKVALNSQNPFVKFLSDNTFAVYVFHAPILIGLSVLVKSVHWHALPKFLVMSLIAVFASFIFGWIIRKIPGFGKLFN